MTKRIHSDKQFLATGHQISSRLLLTSLLLCATTLGGCSTTRNLWDKATGVTSKQGALPVGPRHAPIGNTSYLKGQTPDATPLAATMVEAAPAPVQKPYDSYDAKGNLLGNEPLQVKPVAPVDATIPLTGSKQPGFFERLFSKPNMTGSESAPSTHDDPEPEASARKTIPGNVAMARKQPALAHITPLAPLIISKKPEPKAVELASASTPIMAEEAPAAPTADALKPGFFARLFETEKQPPTDGNQVELAEDKPDTTKEVILVSAEPPSTNEPSEPLKKAPFPSLTSVPSAPPELKATKQAAPEKLEMLESQHKDAEQTKQTIDAESTPLTKAFDALTPNTAEPAIVPAVVAPAAEPVIAPTPRAENEADKPVAKKSWWQDWFNKKPATKQPIIAELPETPPVVAAATETAKPTEQPAAILQPAAPEPAVQTAATEARPDIPSFYAFTTSARTPKVKSQPLEELAILPDSRYSH